MSGVELIAAERQRQIDVEGHAPEDDDWEDGELGQAGAVYALPPETRDLDVLGTSLARILWPWPGWYKPCPDDRIRELTKAGALIAAEIDRLERAQ